MTAPTKKLSSKLCEHTREVMVSEAKHLVLGDSEPAVWQAQNDSHTCPERSEGAGETSCFVGFFPFASLKVRMTDALAFATPRLHTRIQKIPCGTLQGVGVLTHPN